jgi:hypothetical protein
VTAPKFTPGPWRRGELAADHGRIDGPDGRPVAWTAFDRAACLENRSLIVAAPDLYAALRALINCHTGAAWQTEDVQRAAWIAAQEALRKAEWGEA